VVAHHSVSNEENAVIICSTKNMVFNTVLTWKPVLPF